MKSTGWSSDYLRGSGLRPEQYVKQLERAERIVSNRINMARLGYVQQIAMLRLTLLQSTVQ